MSEAYDGPLTLPCSTGITRHRLVTMNTSGLVAYPAAGALATMVTVSKGSTGSTADGQFVSVMPLSRAARVNVEAAGSTLSAGDLIATSSRGRVVAASSNSWMLGQIIGGSSGSTGRVLSVLPFIVCPTSEF